MATRKFIYLGTDGYQVESAGAYETGDFINVSAGAGDAGKPIVLDAAGHVDASMINDADVDHANLTNTHNLTTDIDHNSITNTHNLTTNIDHGSISGLSDDDHSQYSLAAGTRAFTGVVAYNETKTFTLGPQLVDKNYVDTQIAATGTSAEWQESCLDILLTPPGSPSTGDRYLINGTGTDAWAGHDYAIAEWNGSSWDFTAPTTGTFVSVDDDNQNLWYYNGSAWVARSVQALTASLGVEISSANIQLDLSSGNGLALDTNEVYVDVDALVGEGLTSTGTLPAKNMVIDWSTAYNDSKAIKASDLSSTANAKGASIIGVEDAAGLTSNTNVETILAELLTKVYEYGRTYTAGVGGVAKGDLVYISANNTILPMSSLTSGVEGIGLAAGAAAESATTRVLKNDCILTSVLSGATAGDKYYWSGSAFTTTIPTGSGNNVWQVGFAKNATDLQVDVKFLVKRA
jgi:hypothetical protein